MKGIDGFSPASGDLDGKLVVQYPPADQPTTNRGVVQGMGVIPQQCLLFTLSESCRVERICGFKLNSLFVPVIVNAVALIVQVSFILFVTMNPRKRSGDHDEAVGGRKSNKRYRSKYTTASSSSGSEDDGDQESPKGERVIVGVSRYNWVSRFTKSCSGDQNDHGASGGQATE